MSKKLMVWFDMPGYVLVSIPDDYNDDNIGQQDAALADAEREIQRRNLDLLTGSCNVAHWEVE